MEQLLFFLFNKDEEDDAEDNVEDDVEEEDDDADGTGIVPSVVHIKDDCDGICATDINSILLFLLSFIVFSSSSSSSSFVSSSFVSSSSSSDSGIQSKYTPFICFTLSTAHGIGLMFSFNLLSDVAYATTSFLALIKPSVVFTVAKDEPTSNDDG